MRAGVFDIAERGKTSHVGYQAESLEEIVEANVLHMG
jgi:hypothetical protein